MFERLKIHVLPCLLCFRGLFCLCLTQNKIDSDGCSCDDAIIHEYVGKESLPGMQALVLVSSPAWFAADTWIQILHASVQCFCHPTKMSSDAMLLVLLLETDWLCINWRFIWQQREGGELSPHEVGSSGRGEGLVQCPAINQRRELHLDLPIILQVQQTLDCGMLNSFFSSSYCVVQVQKTGCDLETQHSCSLEKKWSFPVHVLSLLQQDSETWAVQLSSLQGFLLA